jgi:SAM-dependent methyltransferase
MVHALEEIHRLLRPVGTLIEIHPVHGAWVEVRSKTETPFVEFDPGFDSDEEVSAENAVRAILDRGLFTLDADREFEFLWYASSVRELRDYFAIVGGYDESPASPRITRLRDELYRRAKETMDRLRTDARVVYREQARISRLIPSGSDSSPSEW